MRRVSLMVALWRDIRERPSRVPSAARPFPYAAVAGTKTLRSASSDSGGAAATWPALFDWPAARDGGGKQKPPAPCEAPFIGPVEVWRAATPGETLGEGTDMPGYDECFQCLC